jgi:hypothetical protein
MERRYLFGLPVRSVRPTADGPRSLFVLGAYPSALHVKWESSDGTRLIRAVAVDGEPEPFWTGEDQEDRIERWKAAVGFRDQWGQVKSCGRLNGSSGAWVRDQVLAPLDAARDGAWVTDCLDTYYESTGAARRLDSDEISALVRTLDISPRRHDAHPSEANIVRLGLANHRQRLISELDTARPDLVVTLGNAALRVFMALASHVDEPRTRLSLERYGISTEATINGRHVAWLPLAHPASPKPYQQAHRQWLDARLG